MDKIETGVWAKTSKNGTKYFFGYDKNTKTKVVIFKNNKDGENQPAMNVIVEDGDDSYNKNSSKDEQQSNNEDEDLPF